MNCPNCNTVILNENINIQTDVAQCHHCHLVFRISESLSAQTGDAFDMENPPKGAWIKREFNGLVIGATTRSPVAIFFVPFMVVWTGGSLGGIYGTQITEGRFDLFATLLGIPFIIGSVVFLAVTLMTIGGKVELTIDNEGGRVFTGFAGIGLRNSFTWDEIHSVKEAQVSVRYPEIKSQAVVMEGKKRIAFGSWLKEARRYYLLKSMQIMLANRKMNRKIF